jgi:hypothetical protein
VGLLTSPRPAATLEAADWSQFDPAAYLNEYYGDLGPENLALLRFLVEVCQDLPRGGILLDFGGGPTIYPLISAVRRASEIHFCDYLEANLHEVRRWISADPASFDWSPFIRKTLELETGASCTDEDVERRTQEIRRRITRLTRCDASKTPPIECPFEPYDIVMTNFCAESATSDRTQWQVYMANIGSLLKPGGWLVMSALKGATHYSVGARLFPAVDISEDDLLELLEDTGFPRKGIEIRSVAADRSTRDYAGLILAVAKKAPGKRKQHI